MEINQVIQQIDIYDRYPMPFTKEELDYLFGERNWSLNKYDQLTIYNSIKLARGSDLIQNGKLLVQFLEVHGDFDVESCNLITLIGCPQIIYGSFYCQLNRLTSLEGGPIQVGGDYYCYDNLLVSLKESPDYVGGTFSCVDNFLDSLEYFPKHIGGNFMCYYNKTKFTEFSIPSYATVVGNIINEDEGY